MEKYLFQLTTDEFKELLKEAYQEAIAGEPNKEDITPINKYSYGLQGLADLLGCSKTTAWKIKESGKLGKAIKQEGRKIIIDNKKALSLLEKR